MTSLPTDTISSPKVLPLTSTTLLRALIVLSLLLCLLLS